MEKLQYVLMSLINTTFEAPSRLWQATKVSLAATALFAASAEFEPSARALAQAPRPQFLNSNQALRFSFGNSVLPYYQNQAAIYNQGIANSFPKTYSGPRFFPGYYYSYNLSPYFGFGSRQSYQNSYSHNQAIHGEANHDCPVKIDSRLQRILDSLKTDLATDDYCVRIGARDEVLNNIISFYLMPDPLVYLRVANKLEDGDQTALREFQSLDLFNNAIAALDRITNKDKQEHYKLPLFEKYKSDSDTLVRLHGSKTLEPNQLLNLVVAYNSFSEKELRDLALALHPGFISRTQTDKEAALATHKRDYGSYDLYIDSIRALNAKNHQEKILTLTQIGRLEMSEKERQVLDALNQRYESLIEKDPRFREITRRDFVFPNIVKLFMRSPRDQERSNSIRIMNNMRSDDTATRFNEEYAVSSYHLYALLRNEIKAIVEKMEAKAIAPPVPEADPKLSLLNSSAKEQTPALLLA